MTGVTPGIFRERSKGRFFIRRINHEHRLALGIPQWSTQNDEAIRGQLIHERRVLVPKRLRANRLARVPGRTSDLVNNE